MTAPDISRPAQGRGPARPSLRWIRKERAYGEANSHGEQASTSSWRWLGGPRSRAGREGGRQVRVAFRGVSRAWGTTRLPAAAVSLAGFALFLQRRLLGNYEVASGRGVTVVWEEGGVTSQQGNVSDEQWDIFKLAFVTTGRIAVLSDQQGDDWMYVKPTSHFRSIGED